jgi:tetratricopeptide (TPR) repeat protein
MAGPGRRTWPLWLAGIVGVSVLPHRPAAAQAQARPQEITSAALRDWRFYNDAGWLYFNRGDYARAEARFRMAIDAVRPYKATSRRLLARSYADLARVLYNQKRYAEAEPLAKWALSVRESEKGVKPEAVHQILYLTAQIQRGQRRYAEAESLLKRSLAVVERALGEHHPASADTLEALAEVNGDQGKNTEAESLYRRSLGLRRAATREPDASLEVAESSERFAAFLRRVNRTSAAEDLEARAKAIRDAAETKAARARSPSAGNAFKGFR